MKNKIATPFDSDAAKRAVLKVGGGCGFVMEFAVPNRFKGEVTLMGKRYRPPRFIRQRIVTTAAHCLPKLPPAHPWAYTQEKTYRILGPFKRKRANILAECLFVDPVADVAILGKPDSGVFGEADINAWDNLMDQANPLALDVGKIAEAPMRGWLLSLDGSWTPCRLQGGRALRVTDATCGIKAGMSGSPILSNDGRVIGLVSVSSVGPQPRLACSLPAWLVTQLTTGRKAK